MYAKKHIGRAEREISVPVLHKNHFFKSPMYKAFPTAADPAGRAVGPLNPLPGPAWHGYGVSSAHHGEVRGCRRAYERTPLRGRRRSAAGGRLPLVNLIAHVGCLFFVMCHLLPLWLQGVGTSSTRPNELVVLVRPRKSVEQP
jgi:hypothetical protein